MASVGRLAAGVAHEIGNPIAALLGLEELLLDGDVDAETQRDFVRRMKKETERISGVLRDLLDFARPEQGAAAGANERDAAAPVGDVAKDVAALVRPQKDFKHKKLDIDVQPADLRVRLAPSRLTQVLLNLVLNASAATRVIVRARAEGKSARIEVEDNGPGIPADAAERVFEPFFTTKQPGEGTGLGLSVCRGLVESAGGTIAVDTTHAPGARLVLTLPLAGVLLALSVLFAGCRGSCERESGSGSGSDPPRDTRGAMAPGVYGDGFSIAFDPSTRLVSGHYLNATGVDPRTNTPETSCEIVFTAPTPAGSSPGAVPLLEAWSGAEALRGRFDRRSKDSFVLTLERTPAACAKVSPALASGAVFARDDKQPPDVEPVIAFRRVAAAQAFFHDAPGAPPRKAFVVTNDIVGVVRSERGWVFVRYAALVGRPTTGWIEERDLAVLAMR
jgi:hypothetical protein